VVVLSPLLLPLVTLLNVTLQNNTKQVRLNQAMKQVSITTTQVFCTTTLHFASTQSQ
jgi:hypothetical protein